MEKSPSKTFGRSAIFVATPGEGREREVQGSIDARDADYQLDETSFFLRRLWPGICKRRFSVTIQKNFGFRFDAVGALLEVAVLRIRVGAPHDRTLDLSCSWEG